MIDKEAISTLQEEFEIRTGGNTHSVLLIAQILAESGVNLTTVSIGKLDDAAYLRLLTSDTEACTRALMKADMDYKTRPVLVAEVDDHPGQWLSAAKRLADAGLEIESSYLLSRDGQKMKFVFAIDDPKRGEEILSKYE